MGTTLTQIINGNVLTPSGWIKDGSVVVEGNKIVEIQTNSQLIEGAQVIDAKGGSIVPGGIDLHIHGGGGRDYMEGTEDAFRKAIQSHMQHGTTSIYPDVWSTHECIPKSTRKTNRAGA